MIASGLCYINKLMALTVQLGWVATGCPNGCAARRVWPAGCMVIHSIDIISSMYIATGELDSFSCNISSQLCRSIYSHIDSRDT